ncbi:MAG: hypothetical protein BVN34_00820 [Proteobacteria bacterium ST_bin12]|nr:MAG: hypothetical protein BVN34_00820 [Proteobacteria bacterium ST_bin12]
MHLRDWDALSKSVCNASNIIPCNAGAGLRAPHYQEILKTLPKVGWFEVHSENYFGAGGQPLYFLEQIRNHYPISLHGVGLSLGSTDELNQFHLKKLKNLIQRIKPGLVSEHLCWGSIGDRSLNDLLPLPYTQEALNHISAHIRQAQDFLDRRIIIENVSSYLQFKYSNIPEWEFLREVTTLSGCGILLDINNIYVNSINHNFDPMRYIDAIPLNAVEEIHLAGFDSNGHCLIDTHGTPVSDEVWALYEYALASFGAKPTLIEWDTDIPPLATLLREAAKAQLRLEQFNAVTA